MGEGFVVAGGYGNVKKLVQSIEIFGGRCGKVPTRKISRAGVLGAVTVKDFWRVVRGVEADAERVCFVVELGIFGEQLLDVGKVAAHADAIVGQRTTGVDEGNEQDLASK